MIKIFRFSPSRLALGYIVLGGLALALFAFPLWYAWNVNVGTFRAYVNGENMQTLVDVFDREGAKGLVAAMEAQVGSMPRDEIMIVADASKMRLAGNLPAWPVEVPHAPGTYGLVIDLGGGSSMRVVISYVRLPGGYHFLMGRESVRFQSLVDLFWYGIAGAMGIVLVLGAVVGWVFRRALLSEVQEVSRTASAIVGGDLSRRLIARGRSDELDTLAQTVNGMLEQLATQNVRLEGEIAVRRQAEHALHRAHGDLEGLVAQRTLQLERANMSLRAAKARFEGILDIAEDAIISVDSSQRILLFNRGAEKVFGHTQSEVNGKSLDLLLPQQFAIAHRRHLEEFARSPDIARVMGQRREIFGIRKNGQEFPAEASISKLDLGGELVFTVILRDVTARKQAEAFLQGEKRLLEMIAKGNPLPTTLDVLCRHVEEMSGGVLCSIMLLDPNAGRMLHGAAPSLSESYIAAIDGWPLTAGPCGMAASLGEPVIASDIALDERWPDEYKTLSSAHGLRACWSTPIVSSEGKVLGTFAMLSHEPGSPSPQHQNTIEQVTHIASIAIERTRAEDRLRRSEAFLAEGQRISHTGSWGWVLSTGRVTWSEEQYRMLGFKPGETEPSVDRFLTAAHPEDRSRVQQNLEVAIKEGRNYAVDYRVVLPNGSVRNMRSVGRPVVAEGGSSVEEYIGVTMDITERVQAEAALRRAQRLEATGTLAGGVAHDFNNILGAILGYGEMALRDAPKGSRLRRDLDSIMSAGERGRALVDRILTFSRSGVGERVAVHVEKVVREALDLLSAKLSDGVRVDMRLHAGRAAMMGDPTQVHQVVMNLATNAVQAMNAGGTLRVSLEVMAVNTRRVATIGEITAAEYIVLQVADDGAGIPPEILDRIFDPFFTTKEVSVGTGLGLSLVHGIVTEVGGAIDVASERGTGSTFTVYLPRTGDAHDAREDLPSTMPRGDRQRVLVVDDEEPLVRLTTETLQELGYVPVGFTSSAAALDAFRADPKTFDAVITDERMPGISGSALIREMRGIRRSIPILLVSGYVGGMVMGRAYNSGANEVLKKPLSAHELATSLARILHLQ